MSCNGVSPFAIQVVGTVLDCEMATAMQSTHKNQTSMMSTNRFETGWMNHCEGCNTGQYSKNNNNLLSCRTTFCNNFSNIKMQDLLRGTAVVHHARQFFMHHGKIARKVTCLKYCLV